jgi:predicted PurR-regulated permease PerM
MVVLVSLVLAVTLEPVVQWLERQRIHAGAALVVGAVPLAALSAFLFAAVAPLTVQTKLLVGRVASFQESIAVRVHVAVARVVRQGPQDPAQMVSAIAAKVPEIGSAVLAAAAMTLFAFITDTLLAGRWPQHLPTSG